MSYDITTVTTDEGEEISLPTKYEVCPQCEGHGTSSAYLGAFTQSEWQEQDEEFRVDYMAGRYDRTCETCKGLRVVEVVDQGRLTPEQKKLYEEAVEDERQYRAICEAERRMGA